MLQREPKKSAGGVLLLAMLLGYYGLFNFEATRAIVVPAHLAAEQAIERLTG